MDDFKNDYLVTRIENFSNEILYEIFDYLDGCDVFNAFSNLNIHFEKILRSPLLQLKMKLSYTDPEESFIKNWKEFVPVHRTQIFSMEIQLFLKTNPFFSSLIINCSFSQLKSLKLGGIKSDIIPSLLTNLSTLSHLQSLNISVGDILLDYTSFYQTFFSLPKLKYCRFETNNNIKQKPTVSLPMATESQLNSIESMYIRQFCSFDELELIVSYMPQLRSLNNLQIYKSKGFPSLNLLNLTSLTIGLYDITFNQLKIYLSKIQSQLEVLHIENSTEDLTYINDKKWEEYLLENFFQLKRFSLSNLIEFEYDEDSLLEIIEPNQFTSSFWINRRMILDMELFQGEFWYSVRSYRYVKFNCDIKRKKKIFPRKQWYDDQNKNPMDQLSKSSRLTIHELPSLDEIDSFQSTLHLISNINQIYHLEIPDSEIDFHTLIHITENFSKLDSLRIVSLYSNDNEDLYPTREKIFHYTKELCQAKKVYLEKINSILDIQFLMNFCPHLEYFQIEYVIRKNVKSVFKLILRKAKDRSNENLRSLCFRVPTVDDQMIKMLKEMIDVKQLLFNYKIERIDEHIYFKWK